MFRRSLLPALPLPSENSPDTSAPRHGRRIGYCRSLLLAQ